MTLAAVRFIFSSSAMRLDLVCRRPAVSTITTSAARALAAATASKTTAAGASPDFCLTTSVALRPDFELFDRSGTKRIRGAKHDAAFFLAQTVGELADAGGFARAVHSDDKDHARPGAVR